MSDRKKILVTVLMPVFNSELFVAEAIQSILKQSYQDFDFLIINDGSTDNSDIIISSFSDNRIKYINNKTNKGIVSTLNEGLKLSTGKYIARMDADDIALPDRLAKQLDFLMANPKYKLCGSRAIAIDVNGKEISKLNRPLHTDQLKVFNLFRNAFIHPTIMADAEAIKKFGYNEDYKYAEDYLLFSQITMNYQVANLNERLLLYRIHDESITSKKKEEMMQSEMKTMAYLLSFLFNEVDQKNLLIHHSILRPQHTTFSLQEVESHLINISTANKEKQIFDQKILDKQLQKDWYNYLLKSNNKFTLGKFLSSTLFRIRNLNLKQVIKLLLK
ncbi:glycosyltransferase [Pedobacter chinensis]|uniref:Glycosyltransferase n=1 Tax=Pedobacter chinensis TaxID=2282421 RepID=A0A369PQB9_9SPHI|nr:glycosyltransferase [Pedobacter chinensis]RDC54754.1 glycosyltransferase [Pedobacter chinensis]